MKREQVFRKYTAPIIIKMLTASFIPLMFFLLSGEYIFIVGTILAALLGIAIFWLEKIESHLLQLTRNIDREELEENE